MTESDWLSCTDPAPMLDFLRGTGRASDRKLRLFACACVRRVWHLLTHEASRLAVRSAEDFADALAGSVEREAARDRAYEAAGQVAASYRAARGGVPFESPSDALYTEAWQHLLAANAATMANQAAAEEAARFASVAAVRAAATERHGHVLEMERMERLLGELRLPQAGLLRCDFANLFRPPAAVEPSWLTPKVVRLAQQLYDSRDFTRLPDLAALLEAAGCRDAEVQGHLRRPGPHARGCHVLDLLLAKR